MAGIIWTPGERTTQPSAQVTANQNLPAVALWTASQQKFAAVGGALATSGHETFRASRFGVGMDMTSGSNAAYNSIAVSSPGDTFVAVVQFTNLSTNSTGILLAGKTNYANGNGFMFESKADENTIEINGGDGGSFPTLAVPGLGTLGQTNTLAVFYSGTSVRVAMNGKYLGGVTLSTPAGTWPSGLGIGNYAGTSTGSNDTQRLYYLAAVVRGGFDLLIPLSKSPWQLFEAENDPVFYSLAGGGGVSVDVPAGAVTLTGYAPTVTAGGTASTSVPSGAVTLTAYAPTVTAGGTASTSVPLGTVTLTGYAPTVTVGGAASIDVPLGTVALTGYAPTVTTGGQAQIDVPLGTVTLTGYVPTVTTTEHVYIAVPTAAMTLAAYAPTVTASGTPDTWTPVSASTGTWTPASAAGGTWTPQ